MKNEVMVELDEEGEEVVEEEEDGVKSSTRLGPETVLDRAVMEHNLLSCSKVSLWAGSGRQGGREGEGEEDGRRVR